MVEIKEREKAAYGCLFFLIVVEKKIEELVVIYTVVIVAVYHGSRLMHEMYLVSAPRSPVAAASANAVAFIY